MKHAVVEQDTYVRSYPGFYLVIAFGGGGRRGKKDGAWQVNGLLHIYT